MRDPLCMRTLVTLVVCFQLAAARPRESPNRMITPARAKVLVLAALTPKQRRLPELGADQYQDPNSSRFLFFTVTWGAKPNQSVVVGNYAVDPYTGDVWSAVVECTELHSRHLRTLQAQIRSFLKLSHSEYMRLKTPVGGW
jgi:hypothetical protein